MKETLVSNCEKKFIQTAASQFLRLDGRELDEYRNLEIHFGSDWGSCQVNLGETRVLAQASCEIQQPKATRPNEGLLYLNVELSPMGAPHFEAGRQSELAVQLNRLMEKCYKDSHCVDLESLCIVAEEKVWAVRVDVNVLNHEGSLADAASIAAITALSHFRRPDVTTAGELITVHDSSEKDPIPLSLHHHPVCVTFAVFNKGMQVIADPTALEERVAEAHVTIAVNAYRELCGLHLGGQALTSSQCVLQCASRAAKRAAQVVTKVKEALARDAETRSAGPVPGFVECVRDSMLTLCEERLSIRLNSRKIEGAAKKLVANQGRHRPPANGDGSSSVEEVSVKDEGEDEDDVHDDDDNDEEPVVIPLDDNSADLVPTKQVTIGEGGPSQWEQLSSSSSSEDETDSDSSGLEVVKEVHPTVSKPTVEEIELIDDSDEDLPDKGQTNRPMKKADKKIIQHDVKHKPAKDLEKGKLKTEDAPTSKTRGWYPKW